MARPPTLRFRHPAAALLVGVALLSAAHAQQEQYRERQVLDPESDEWVDRQPETQATPEAGLDQARSLLAQGKPSKARSILKKWVKNNAGHDRYYEGVYLLGEALFETKDFYAAYERYETVLENASGELYRSALQREMDAARAFLSGQKRIIWKIFRLPAYEDGIKILDRVWERVPGTRMGEEALRLKADYFFNSGEMQSAQDEYANLAKEYPSGRYVRPAMLRAAEASAATFAGVKFDDRPLVEANERYSAVKATFPEYAARQGVDARLEGIRVLRAEKDLSIAKWYEKTGQRGAAEFYYREILKDWSDTLAAAEARTRLRGMGIDAEGGSE